jgi:hypothetical protein
MNRSKQLRRNQNPKMMKSSGAKDSGILDFTKWFGIVTSLAATFFLASSVAYRIGYWRNTGVDISLVQFSTIDLTFLGFINSIYPSLYVLGLAFFWTIAIIIIEQFSKEKIYFRNLPKSPSFSEGLLLSCVLAFLALVITVFTFNMVINQGSDDFSRTYCRTKLSNAFPTIVYLDNGQTLDGFVLARSEKVTVLMTKEKLDAIAEKNPEKQNTVVSVKVVSLGDKPRVLDSTKITSQTCKM